MGQEKRRKEERKRVEEMGVRKGDKEKRIVGEKRGEEIERRIKEGARQK